jgi:hypothetical protein
MTVVAILLAVTSQQAGWLPGQGKPIRSAILVGSVVAIAEIAQSLFSRMQNNRLKIK